MPQSQLLIQLFKEQKPIAKYQLLDGRDMLIGRSDQADLQLPDYRLLSNRQLQISYRDGQIFLTDLSSNGCICDGQKLTKGEPQLMSGQNYIVFSDGKYGISIQEESQNFQPVTKIRITKPGNPIQTTKPQRPVSVDTRQASEKTIISSSDVQTPVSPNRKRIRISGKATGAADASRFQALLKQKKRVTIGRDPSNDIVLDSLIVSRKHALIEEFPQGVLLTNHSVNGSFVNGKLVKDSQTITKGDVITIGNFKFSIDQGIADVREIGTSAIQAFNIEKKFPDGYLGLKPLSLEIPSKEFVALMGPSGCGKSTLMRCLNGDNPATMGQVHIQGLPLNKENFNTIKRNIGYVPQENIVHGALTIDDTMYYAAKLRLSEDVSDAEIANQIERVLNSLNINEPELRQKPIKKLSGGQQKRVSIAVEILTEPAILFLDEPTSPLDPETIDDFLKCIQQLTKQGTTVIMVTHKPEDLSYTDKVIFLSKGGYLTYYGPPKGVFDNFELPEQDIIKIYALLSKVENGEKLYYNWRRKQQSNHQKLKAAEKPSEPTTESPLSQLYWLTKRYLAIKRSDTFNIKLLIAQPFIIAGLVSLIFESLQAGVLFLMAISAIWFGVSNAAKEIVSEQAIYKRERMYNLNIWTYLASKVLVLSMIALGQVIIFVAILWLMYGFSDSEVILRQPLSMIVYMFYLAVSATLLGLFLSTRLDTEEKVMTAVPIALIPQILLAGVITFLNADLKEILSYLTLSRWGTEGLARIQDNAAEAAESWHYINGPTTDTLLASIDRYVPVPSGDSLFLQPISAIDHLKYNASERLAWFDSLPENFLALTILNLIAIGAIYYYLKKKDSLV